MVFRGPAAFMALWLRIFIPSRSPIGFEMLAALAWRAQISADKARRARQTLHTL